MTTIPPVRRFAVSLAAVVLAALLLHGQVATALVTRGDDLLRAGDIDGAIRAYERATRLDAVSPAAYDRLAFYLLLRRHDGDTMRAWRIADAALARRPGDPALLADRGFASLRLHRYERAARDFAAAGVLGHDARYARLGRRLAQR